MLQNLTGWHALIILAIVLLVFGAAKLPSLARSVGQSVRILKAETSETPDDSVTPRVPDARTTADARSTADAQRATDDTAVRLPEHSRP